DTDVAVVGHAVDGRDCHGGGDDADWHTDQEEQRLRGRESQKVLDHMGAGGGETVELEYRVMHLVDAPERVVAMQGPVYEEGHEVEDHDTDQQPWKKREPGDSVTDGCEAQTGEDGPEDERRHRGGGKGDPVPGDVGNQLGPGC